MSNRDEYETFNRAMETILKADPAKVRAEMEADKQERAKKRKSKKSSALGHSSRVKG